MNYRFEIVDPTCGKPWAASRVRARRANVSNTPATGQLWPREHPPGRAQKKPGADVSRARAGEAVVSAVEGDHAGFENPGEAARIYSTSFASVYPLYVAKAERKGARGAR